MALDDGQYAQLLQAALKQQGANGSNLEKFCKLLATGINKSVKGKSFQTIDTGTIPGVGQGTGQGILGLMPDSMAKIALAAGPTMAGANALKLLTGIMMATQQYMAIAPKLTTTDTPAFLGAGMMVLGSLQVNMDEMKSNIVQAFKDAKAGGKNIEPLSKAIATGVTFGLLTMGTGTVVIVGAPTGIPVGGAGPGMGTVS